MNRIKRYTILLLILTLTVGMGVDASFAENIDPYNDGSQYAYGENVGFLNFEPDDNGGSGAEVTSSRVTGYVWQENADWINLSPSNYGGVLNDGNGNLSGYAWGENVGWINFNPTGGGVTIDENGNFNGYAWGENIGWIHFQNQNPAYKVQTEGLQDSDGDGVPDVRDVCPGFDDKVDTDGDGIPDGCDSDKDGDTYTSAGGDCNDLDAAVHPFATEICDGVDNNCDGQIDENVKTTYYRDADGDGYGDPNTITENCTQPSGYVTDNTDCNDTNAAIHPGATETCDGVDNNCNGQVDENAKTTYYRDADGDGYGDPNTITEDCTQPSGYVADNTDCNDNNPGIHPGAQEVPYDGIDQDCNGSDLRDVDGDGHAAVLAGGDDCNDLVASIHPDATEIANNDIDEDCDGADLHTSEYTQTGDNVVVQPQDSTTGQTPITITLGEVIQSGETTVSSSSQSAPPPSGFKLMANPPVYYELNTTAVFQGVVTICVAYPDNLPPGKEQNLKLFHYEDTNDPKDGILDTWIDVTTSKDTANNIICGAVTSFSPFAVFVQNQVPVANAGADRTTEAGGVLTDVILDGSDSSDPDGDFLGYTWSGPFGMATGATVTVQLGVGTHTITLTVDDGSGGSASDEVIITVQDTTTPTVSNTTVVPNPVAVNTLVTLTATVTDTASNVNATYSTDGVNWTPMNMDTTTHVASVTINSGFATSEVYDICVKGTDAEGNESTECIYLPVYDPSAGFVTGGGWIWSPKGAYVRDAILEGKAHFGFVAKYKKGANTPEGNTEFQFSTADFTFHSNTYDWLVVAGYKAMFKGIGTIEGEEGSHKFMISCVDGDLKGNGAKDTFRIRIWDEDGNGGETTIYDNQMGADMDAEATTKLGGGSIIIHKVK